MPAGWLDASDVSQWLRKRNIEVCGIPQKGGILIGISAHDPASAVDTARERLERLAAHVLAGSDREFVLLPTAWIDGEPREFRLTRAGRDVDVDALERKKQVYEDPGNHAVVADRMGAIAATPIVRHTSG